MFTSFLGHPGLQHTSHGPPPLGDGTVLHRRTCKVLLTENFKYMLWAYFLDYRGNICAPLD